VEYTLETGLADGKMIYTGKGGDIDGKINPDLKANVGDTVKVILISGEGAQHNILFEGADAKSEDVVGPGNSVTLEFTPNQDGTFAYYCDVPGHRQAGMEGKFIVGSGVATAAASAGNTYATSGTVENVSVSAGRSGNR
jgi:nitrite reductase (NO-forming)